MSGNGYPNVDRDDFDVGILQQILNLLPTRSVSRGRRRDRGASYLMLVSIR